MLLAAAFGSGILLASLALVLARRTRVMALPDHRSSHDRPTATLGGIAIVVPVLVACSGQAEGSMVLPVLLLGGGALAVVGLLDDILTLPARVRLPVHLFAVLVALKWLPLPALVLPPLVLVEPWLVFPVTGFVLLWLINLYNFMDGIDGLAAVQCVTFCGGAVLLGASGAERDLLIVATGAALGFLVLNWAPAKIFMGDVASGFLGFFAGVVAVSLASDGRVPFVASMILLTGFWFDASYTLCARILTRQNIAAPHRSHLYQKCARRFGHGWTTLAYLVLNVFWLMPLAWLADTQAGLSALWLAAAALPYLAGCVRARAGMPGAGA